MSKSAARSPGMPVRTCVTFQPEASPPTKGNQHPRFVSFQPILQRQRPRPSLALSPSIVLSRPFILDFPSSILTPLSTLHAPASILNRTPSCNAPCRCCSI
eukprot:1594948-Rhodomonas_salina.2